MTQNTTSVNYETSDIAIAAYLMVNGYKLLQCMRQSDGKFYFEFSDPAGAAFSHAVEYVHSDCSKFDNHIRNLKKLLYKR